MVVLTADGFGVQEIHVWGADEDGAEKMARRREGEEEEATSLQESSIYCFTSAAGNIDADYIISIN